MVAAWAAARRDRAALGWRSCCSPRFEILAWGVPGRGKQSRPDSLARAASEHQPTCAAHTRTRLHVAAHWCRTGHPHGGGVRLDARCRGPRAGPIELHAARLRVARRQQSLPCRAKTRPWGLFFIESATEISGCRLYNQRALPPARGSRASLLGQHAPCRTFSPSAVATTAIAGRPGPADGPIANLHGY